MSDADTFEMWQSMHVCEMNGLKLEYDPRVGEYYEGRASPRARFMQNCEQCHGLIRKMNLYETLSAMHGTGMFCSDTCLQKFVDEHTPPKGRYGYLPYQLQCLCRELEARRATSAPQGDTPGTS